jgi:hypothetical protein
MSGAIGCLGDIIFQVSDKTVRTLTNLMISGSAKIIEHNIVGRKSLAEFTGSDAGKISFNMKLTEELGVDVEGELERIEKYCDVGATLPLVIGRKIYGRHRWMIKSHSSNVLTHDSIGRITTAVVTLNLIEYLRG